MWNSPVESFEIRYEDENIWLTQKMMATLYGVSVPAISPQLRNILRTENCLRIQLLRIGIEDFRLDESLISR